MRPAVVVAAALVFAGLGGIVTAGPASAQQAAIDSVRGISIEYGSTDGNDSGSVLELTFESPVPRAEASKIEQDLGQQVVAEEPGVRQELISCEGKIDRTDQHARFTIAYVCHGNGSDALPWSIRLVPAVQAIVVGNINEAGMSWRRNGVNQPRNAPHVVPPDYLLHGTLRPVYGDNNVDYSDVITFRHNIGSGGNARLVVRGAVRTLHEL